MGAGVVIAFRWQDGERLIVFGSGAAEQAWSGAEIFTTQRALSQVPAGVRDTATAVHIVPSGQVPDVASAVAAAAVGERIVAFGGGRVIDVAKAVAAARGGTVCAVPTTLSGAEMSSRHRSLAGFEDAPPVRPALVLADPALMAGQPERPRRWSAMNAMGHAVQACCSAGRNPVASLAAARAAGLLAGGLDAPGGDPEALAEGAILAGYAIGSAGLGFHHALCQTVVRACDASHSGVNAALLPVTAGELLRRYPPELAQVRAALGGPADIADRLAQLGGGVRLRDLDVPKQRLGEIATAAAARCEIRAMPDPPDADALARSLSAAW